MSTGLPPSPPFVVPVLVVLQDPQVQRTSTLGVQTLSRPSVVEVETSLAVYVRRESTPHPEVSVPNSRWVLTHASPVDTGERGVGRLNPSERGLSTLYLLLPGGSSRGGPYSTEGDRLWEFDGTDKVGEEPLFLRRHTSSGLVYVDLTPGSRQWSVSSTRSVMGGVGPDSG